MPDEASLHVVANIVDHERELVLGKIAKLGRKVRHDQLGHERGAKRQPQEQQEQGRDRTPDCGERTEIHRPGMEGAGVRRSARDREGAPAPELPSEPGDREDDEGQGGDRHGFVNLTCGASEMNGGSRRELLRLPVALLRPHPHSEPRPCPRPRPRRHSIASPNGARFFTSEANFIRSSSGIGMRPLSVR